MNKTVKVWLVAWVLLWLSFTITFLVDYLGIIETSNLGYIEEIWISWMMWTVVLGFALAILTRSFVKR